MRTTKSLMWVIGLAGTMVASGIKGAPAEVGGKPAPTGAAALSKEDQAALDLGRKMLAVQRAIAHPDAPESMKAVKALGTGSGHDCYIMVRGWLSYQLAGDKSIADANGANTAKAVKDRIAFLQKAIRAIDLE